MEKPCFESTGALALLTLALLTLAPFALTQYWRKAQRALTYTLITICALASVFASATPSLPHSSALPSSCHLVLDAGSSGTRLFVYQFSENTVTEHKGRESEALAAPVLAVSNESEKQLNKLLQTSSAREIYQAFLTAQTGESPAKWLKEVAPNLDTMQATIEAVASIIKPSNEKFNWQAQCREPQLSVLATAGMRMAEQQKPAASQLIWAGLALQLEQAFSNRIKTEHIQVRTISGYEEGLFAWLAVRHSSRSTKGMQDKQDLNQFGIVEMGGASSQITFPCEDCENTLNAVRQITLDNKTVNLFSYSFLGLGQDQAPLRLGLPSACINDVRTTPSNKNWRPEDCLSSIHLQQNQLLQNQFHQNKDGNKNGEADNSNNVIFDPLNYNQKGATKRGKLVTLPAPQKHPKNWVLTGAFNYMDTQNNIDACCLSDPSNSSCFNANFGCYQAHYREAWLSTLAVTNLSLLPSKPINFIGKPYSCNHSDSDQQLCAADESWTLGAALCAKQGCLPKNNPPVCRWLKNGCLSH